MMIALLLWSTVGWSQDLDDPLDDDFLIEEDAFEDLADGKAQPSKVSAGTSKADRFDTWDDEEDEFPAFTMAAPKRVVPNGLALETAGKKPLTGNWSAEIVATDNYAVVVELPVLVARSRAEFTEGMKLIASVFVGETRVAEAQQLFIPLSIAEFTPTVAWFKLHVPVPERSGQVKVLVRRAPLDGGEPQRLFVKGASYTLQ